MNEKINREWLANLKEGDLAIHCSGGYGHIVEIGESYKHFVWIGETRYSRKTGNILNGRWDNKDFKIQKPSRRDVIDYKTYNLYDEVKELFYHNDDLSFGVLKKISLILKKEIKKINKKDKDD